MSVRTTAQEIRDKAKDHIDEARRQLTRLIGEQPWGWDDWSAEYRREVTQAWLNLSQMDL